MATAGMASFTVKSSRIVQQLSAVSPKSARSHPKSAAGIAGRRPTVRCAASEGEEPERIKGIFEFVIDNPSSKNAIQLESTPAQDGNLGQMISVSKPWM